MLTEDRKTQAPLDYFVQPATMTAPGAYAPLFDGLPRDVAALAAVAQGLLIHEQIAPAYGVMLADERRATVHVRPVAQILERLVTEDDRPLTTARPPARRLAVNCRHFTVLTVAMLRAQGVPARARCGFGDYFGSGACEDHWVCEYWHAETGRWRLADAQIDGVQRAMFPVEFDPLDVPRDRFVVAGDAWARCRAGNADPAKYGLSALNQGGLWWIAGNLLRDVAALNNMEMLPWDVWGAMPAPGASIDDERLALFDRLAGLTHTPDAAFAELRATYADDDRLRVPATVFNAILQRPEAVSTSAGALSGLDAPTGSVTGCRSTQGASMDTVRSTDGTSIAFERMGQGPPLILVGGALSDRSAAAPLAAALAPRFTVFTYDRRGRGESGDTAPYAVAREVEDLAALIGAAGGPAFVFGHSSGAALALEAAARGLPIAKLALYEPPFIVDDSRPPVPPGYAARLAELLAAGRRGEAVACFMTEAVGVPAEAVAQMRQAPMWPALELLAHTLPYDGAVMGDNMSGHPLPAAWTSAVAVPTLVLAGGASPPWIRNAAQAVADILPHAQIRTLEGQTHATVPEVVAPVVADFFVG